MAFRKAGNTAKNDHVADTNSHRLERKPGVRERIEYLMRQAQERIAEKRVALEEQLWAVLEADIGAFWETYEAAKTTKGGELETDQDGKMLTARQANRDLREMLNIDRRKEQEADDVSRLSDAELVQQLSDQAKQLGIEINLNYSFLQQQKPDDERKG